MPRSIPVLVNPQAGDRRRQGAPDDLAEVFREAGLVVTPVETTSPDEMRQALRRLVAEGAERVVVVGGDGTVAAAVQVLAETPTALGIVPQGTANNFAAALGLPMTPLEAARVVRGGVVRAVDLGRVGDRYFTEAAGVGLFADILALYGRTNKNPLRALYAVARVYAGLEATRLSLVVDGQPMTERAVMVTAANTVRMATAVPLAPGARVSDGLLDVVVVGDVGRSEILRYYRAARRQAHLDLPKVSRLRAREVGIRRPRGLAVHADDRVVGTTPATITIARGALRVLVPEPADRLH